MNAKIINSLYDLYRGGPRFFLSGLVCQWSQADTVTVNVTSGQRFVVRPRQSDFGTVRQVFRDQDYRLPGDLGERVDLEYARICENGMTPVIIDAGANVAAASVWFHARFPNAAVIAIEPDPLNAEIARKNVEGLSNVTILEAAVGGAAGFVSLVPAEEAWAVRTTRSETGCKIVTIDQAVALVPSGKLLIAKIDIEGFESDLFEGDLRWMDDVFAVYLEPHDWMLPGRRSSRSFQIAFARRDFDIHLQSENLIYVRPTK